MADVPEHLPFTVPKSVPRWVMGFPNYLRDELKLDEPEVEMVHTNWLRYEAQYWQMYHGRGKPRKPRRKPDPPPEGAADLADMAGPDGEAPARDGDAGEPPAKQAKTRLDTRVRSKWRRKFERLRAIARQHAIAELETEVADMERDLDEE